MRQRGFLSDCVFFINSMSETKKLRLAQEMISANQMEKSSKLLWKLYESKHLVMKLGAILSLITVINHVRENNKLIELADEGLKIATSMSMDKERVYLLIRKSHFLITQSSNLVSRQRNLKMAANVFDWIDFSLKKDKEEYVAISERRLQLMQEIENMEKEVLSMAISSIDHRFRGNIYVALAEFYAVKFFNDRMDLMRGGSWRSWLANIYFVRRWNLDWFIVFNRESRRQVRGSEKRCFHLFEKAIEEFQIGGHTLELAYAFYNFAVNLKALNNSFHKAGRFLRQAKELAKITKEERLMVKIADLEKALEDKNRHIRNYVEELGLG